MTLTLQVAACAATASFLISGCAAKEGGQSLFIRHAKLTLMDAAVIAEKSVPDSNAIKVELTHQNDAVFYEVEVLKKVLVDAETGQILSSPTSNPPSSMPHH
jgi:uncharacterized membrane protein YkoI